MAAHAWPLSGGRKEGVGVRGKGGVTLRKVRRLKNWSCTSRNGVFVWQEWHCACATKTRLWRHFRPDRFRKSPTAFRRGTGERWEMTARLCVLRWWGTLGTRLWRHTMTSLPVWRDSNDDVTSGLAGCSLWGMGQVMTTQCFRSTKFLFGKNHTKRNNVYLFIRFKIYFSYRGLSGGLFWEPCGSPPARAGCDKKKQRICKGTGWLKSGLLVVSHWRILT